jgi:methionine-rich copper-binding protein CopC
MREITIFAMLLLLLLGGSGAARAHAYLDRASPLVGSTVGSSPAHVTLYFTQNLERRFSRLEVRNAGGARVDRGNVSVNGSVMRIGVKGLAPGRYSVHWRVLSVDTHTTEGNFAFYVGR